MRAIIFDHYGPPGVLQWSEREKPRLGKHDVLVRVRATSVNPIDWKLRSGAMRWIMPQSFPKVLGFDVSGEIVAMGSHATAFAIGDEVFGMQEIARHGANAEFVAIRESALARKPSALSHEEAAALPLAGLTAMQALHAHARTTASERVLVLGASGGVGAFAVQIAKACGAHVTGVCSRKNERFVRELGADEVSTYDTSDVSRTFDVVFDAVGLGSYFSCRRYLNERGRFVSTIPSAKNAIAIAMLGVGRLFGNQKRAHMFLTKASGSDLANLAALVTDAKLRVPLEGIYPLEDLGAAHARSQTGRVTGKLAVLVASA